MTALTREKTHAIVSSLARGRSVAMTAERCHVGAGVVQMLRDHYGPDPVQLEAASRELAKPVPTTSTAPAPKEPAVTSNAHTPTPAPKPSIAGITAAIDAHMDGVTDPRILKLHERATAALAALVDALDGHRKAAKVNAEIADLEARLAKARDERAKITGRPATTAQQGAAAPLGPGVAKAVRAWAATNGVACAPVGRPPKAVVDAWRAATTQTTSTN